MNSVPTPDGGTHDTGFRAAVVKSIRNYISTHNLDPKGVTLTSEDIREGLVAVVSTYVHDPQFQSQTKNRLNNPEVAAQVEALRAPGTRELSEREPGNWAQAVIGRVDDRRSRTRGVTRSAPGGDPQGTPISHRLNLPGKLTDCSFRTDPNESELFIVEKVTPQVALRSRAAIASTQAILPLRGKVSSTPEQAKQRQKLLANKELQDIVSALGCGIGDSFDASKLRYGKIFLLMDADADGNHIATLR